MGAKISTISVLNSLSLGQLRMIAKTLGIDLKPKLSEMPLIKIRGERHFTVDRISEVIGITIKDIDNILGTNFSKGRTEEAGKRISQDSEKADFKEVLLDKYASEEDIEIILYDLKLSVSGNKDAQIQRIIDSGQIDILDIIELLDKDALIETCDFLGLETSGTEDQLKTRILIKQGFDVQAEQVETQ